MTGPGPHPTLWFCRDADCGGGNSGSRDTCRWCGQSRYGFVRRLLRWLTEEL